MTESMRKGRVANYSALEAIGRVVTAQVRRAAMVRHRLFAEYLRLSVSEPPARLDPPVQASIEQLLVIRLDEIGDFVLTTAFLRAIRRHYPQARITLLVNTSVEGLARACPYIDELLLYPVRRRAPPFDQLRAYAAARRFARERLCERRFQLAVIPRVDIDNACALAMAYHAKIPLRVGYDESSFALRQVKDRNFGRFLTHVVERNGSLHEVLCSLRVAAFLGADVADARLALWPRNEEIARAREYLSRFSDPHRRLIALAPGGGLERRQWPPRSFASVAGRLIEEAGVRIVLVGGRGEERIAEQVIADSAVDGRHLLNTTGRLSLGEAAALLGCCDLFIGNDSGPMHMAAAMKVPCVEISCHPLGGDPVGENSPARFSPWLVPSRILRPRIALPPCQFGCSKPYAHCITTVQAADVLQAATELLATRSSTRAASSEERHGSLPAV